MRLLTQMPCYVLCGSEGTRMCVCMCKLWYICQESSSALTYDRFCEQVKLPSACGYAVDALASQVIQACILIGQFII